MEIWKPVKGYEGLYEVSNKGDVASLRYKGSATRKVLTPKVNNCGRMWVELRNNGERKYFLIHRLVAEAFIPNPNRYPQINHIDENPKNNIVENLEWCTGSQNMRAYYANHPGKRRKARRNQHPILQLTIDGEFIKRWSAAIEIKHIHNYHPTSIWECCEGKRSKAYGYKWQYDTSNITE